MLFYIVFTAIYNLYLQQFDQKKNELDDFTELVATHTVKIMSLFYFPLLLNLPSYKHADILHILKKNKTHL